VCVRVRERRFIDSPMRRERRFIDVHTHSSPMRQGNTTSNLPQPVPEVTKWYKDIASDKYGRVATYRSH
jgi:hypothetical protein